MNKQKFPKGWDEQRVNSNSRRALNSLKRRALRKSFS